MRYTHHCLVLRGFKLSFAFAALLCLTSNLAKAQFCDPYDPYDKIISSYHASVAKRADGSFVVWGEETGPGSSNPDLLSPTIINAANGFSYTGNPMFATMGSHGEEPQMFFLTTTGLYVWGTRGLVVASGLCTNDAFQKISPSGSSSSGLPATINPTDVKMMTGTRQGLAILTHSGAVYVLGSGALLYGDGTTTANAVWHQVKINASTVLSNVVQLRICYEGAFAVTNTNNWYTWGTNTVLGNSTAKATRTYATLMTKPTAFTSADASDVKMIGITSAGSGVGYYVVHATDKKIYVTGENGDGNLGIGNTTDQTSWSNVLQAGSGSIALANVKFISIQEHDDSYMVAGAIQENGTLLQWGHDSYSMAGGNGDITRPAVPQGIVTGTDKTVMIEIGGHFAIIIKEGSSNYCYIGHMSSGSMGSGSSSDNEIDAYDCAATPVLTVCGATSFDAGDAPLTYENGNYATHTITGVQQLKLGITAAGADNFSKKNVTLYASNNGSNGDGVEEDGITTLPVFTRSGSYSVSINTVNASGVSAYLYAWVDWNQNGLFESTELFTTTIGTGSVTTTANWTGISNLVNNNQLYLRLRFTGTALVDNVATSTIDERSIGAASNGEIEDYLVTAYDVAVSGNVWDDANGNAIKNGTEPFTNAASLYANLIGDANIVLQSTAVNAVTGAYSLGGLGSTSYKVMLSNGSITVGGSLAASSLPSGWVHTGLNSDGTPDTNNRNGIQTLAAHGNFSNRNFGVEKKPILNSQSFTINSPSTGTLLALDGSGAVSSPGPLSATDEEDGTMGSGSSFYITSLAAMNGNKLLYNGSELTEFSTIGAYNPSLLKIQFSGIGSQSLAFGFTAIDNAGVSGDPVNYAIFWNAVLPIQLVGFTASNKNGITALNWQTASEFNSLGFGIEYSSDGVSFNRIGYVDAVNKGSQLTEYRWQHVTSAAVNYYRLKMNDKDGTSKYSNVLRVLNTGKIEYDLYPNPASDKVRLTMPQPACAGSYCRLLDASGRLIKQINISGQQFTDIDLSALSSGVYFVTVSSGRLPIFQTRFIKQ